MGQAVNGPKSICLASIIKFLLLSILILSPLIVAAAEPEPPSSTVDAIGTSVVSGGNTALARDAAIADALRKAVEQAVGTLIASDTMVENYQVLNDSVYTKTQGYVQRYNVINEGQTMQGMYQATVRATVALGRIKDDLNAMGLLQKKMERPRVLFMIAEKNIGHKYYVFWWWGRSEYRGETVDISAAESTLKEIFLNKGFNVVDMTGSTDKIEVSDAFKVSDLTQDGARKIGKNLNAEIVVYGKAVATEGPRTPGSSVGSYLADITAQAVRVDDGVVLASTKGHGVSRNISEVTGGTEAISKASAEAADKMIDQIAAKWSSGHSVTLKVRGVTDYRKMADFKNMIKARVRGVESIYQRNFEGTEIFFEVDSKVPAQNLADEIARLPLPLKVTGTTSNTILIFFEAQ